MMVSLEQQIELLHKSLLEKFQELKEENQLIEIRLKNIEIKLNSNENKKQDEETHNKVFVEDGQSNTINDPAKKQSRTNHEKKKDKRNLKSKLKNNKKKIEKQKSAEEVEDEDFDQNDSFQNMGNLDNLKLVTADEETSEDVLVDDGFRHDVETKSLPNRSFEGHSFRPVTGWRNKNGNFEISKEVVEFSESKVFQKYIFYEF